MFIEWTDEQRTIYLVKGGVIMNQENTDMFSLENSKSPLYLHVAKTYAWMAAGLMITFLTALLFCWTGAILWVLTVPLSSVILLICELALVIFLTGRLEKITVSKAKAMFMVYSVVSGIALTPIFLVYDMGSIVYVFGITALFFGVMAVGGLVTKKDLSRFGPLVVVALITLLILTVVNLILSVPAFDMFITYLGVLIFLGVTAYDSNKIRSYYYNFENQPEMLEKVAIISALNLYLDFLNLFLYILKLLGKKK